MIIVSLLTIYMAIRSRRFIAIAGVACPILVLLIKQAFTFSPKAVNSFLSAFISVIALIWMFFWNQILLVLVKLVENNDLTTKLMNMTIDWKIRFIISLFGLAITAYLYLLQNQRKPKLIFIPISLYTIGVLILCVTWGMKYKQIYLDPWPTDDRYNTVFMRMTASHLKPFEVCQFINDNQIKGRVFNYWTEGGAVAFGQKPDPKTGQIPLKLFMDGRAQAAYDHAIFRLWQTIHSGGPIAQKAMMKDKKITPERMKEVGAWIDGQLNKYDVWVVLMPKSQENSTLMRALKKTPNWKTAYLDNTQHLLVNIETPQGQELINKILKGEAVFPDAYSKNMTTSAAIFENNDRQRFDDLYPLIKAAFEERQDPSTALAMNRLTSLPALRPRITKDLQNYLDDFIKHKNAYQKEDGYSLRLSNAEISARLLSQLLPEEKTELSKLAATLRGESMSLSQAHIW